MKSTSVALRALPSWRASARAPSASGVTFALRDLIGRYRTGRLESIFASEFDMR